MGTPLDKVKKASESGGNVRLMRKKREWRGCENGEEGRIMRECDIGQK